MAAEKPKRKDTTVAVSRETLDLLRKRREHPDEPLERVIRRALDRAPA